GTLKTATYRIDIGPDSQVAVDYNPTSGTPLNTRTTDLSGKIYLPNTSQRAPLLVLLHGNHFTCGCQDLSDPNSAPYVAADSHFTENGTCDDPTRSLSRIELAHCYVSGPNSHWEEVRSYEGYDYVAKHLAYHGFMVVSINANRGITGAAFSDPNDRQGILARGRLVLKHLYQLQKWNEGVETSSSVLKDQATNAPVDLTGTIDFGNVGLMGHSRGGEGVRAAYEMYTRTASGTYARDLRNMQIKAVLEIAPVDLQAASWSTLPPSPTFDATGANWAVVIASCDQDVDALEGTGTFRRRRMDRTNAGNNGSSSVFVVPGADHNHFNTEWRASDSTGCIGTQSPLWESSSRHGLPTAQADVGHFAFFFGVVAVVGKWCRNR
ncbi:hypothetical protein ACFL5O_06700, partial [Myxococcota bacterium]